ncbi:unnamed protein product, partial [Heterosigma akashiwo]
VIGKIVKVVLSGGPNGGKTTAIQVVPALLKSDPQLNSPKVLAIPEVPTLIMEMGVHRAEELMTNSEKLLAFQEAVFDVQLALEDTTMKLTRKLASCSENRARDIIVLIDRGLMDCKEYVPQHIWEAILLKKNMSEEAILARYDAVIHLRSVAVEDLDMYDELTVSNRVRIESKEQAATQDTAEWNSWIRHPAHMVINNGDD